MRFALLDHERAVAASLVRQLTRRWRDLLTVLLVLPLAALFLRAWLADLPPHFRDLALCVAVFLMGATLFKSLLDRIVFHRTEGALAQFAQRRTDAFGYIAPLLAAGLIALVGGIFAIAGQVSGWAVLAIFAGLATGLLASLAHDRIGAAALGRTPDAPRLLEQEHGLALAGIVSVAMGLFCALLPPENQLNAFVVGGYALIVAILTGRVEPASVRYMAMVGMSATELLRRYVPLQIALLMPTAAVLALSRSWDLAGIAAGVTCALPAITMLRIFAYRALSRMLADWAVAILIAVAAYLTLTFPPLGPLAIIAAILWLARRGGNARWLIA